MIYVRIVLLILTFAFFVMGLLSSKKALIIDFKDFEELNNVSRHGRALPILKYKHLLKSFYRETNRRKENGEKLFDFEIKICENLFRFNKVLLALQSMGFKRLPYYNGVPRVLLLTRFAVSRGYDETPMQIKAFIETLQRSVELDYKEIELFSLMLSYAELENLLYLCRKSKLLYREKRKAYVSVKKGGLKRAHSNCFWYYYNEIGEVPELYEGVAEEAICSFKNTLLSYSLIVERAVDVMQDEKVLHEELSIEYVRAGKVLKKLDIYERESSITKRYYLNKISGISNKLNIRETAIAELALSICDCYNLPLGKVLNIGTIRNYIKKGTLTLEKLRMDIVYALLVLSTSLLVSFVPILFISMPLAVVYVPILFICILKPIESLYRHLFAFKEKSPLYSLALEKVPKDAKTTVVVSFYIMDRDGLERGVFKIESIAANLSDENVFYCLLVDIDYNSLSENEIEELRASIKEYNSRNDRIQIALRKPIIVNNKRISWERKRGAILELFKYINSDSDGFYEIKDEIKNSKYAILLNDDSELLPSTILKAINTMIHPMNEEYDILSFGAKINKYSIITKYSRRYSEDGSIDCYPCYNDFYSDAFDKGLFDGKGIVKINSFVELYDTFPDSRVLSHGLLEGAFLHTGSLKQCIYEDAPQNFKNDVERYFRWKKGDVLLLPYLSLRFKNRKGGKVSNNIGVIYKLIILINALDCVRDFMLLISVFLGILTLNYSLLYISLILIASPFICRIIKGVLSILKIRVYYVLRDIGKNVAHLLERFFFLPYYAFEGLKVYFKATFQSLIGSKRILEWRPFYISQGKGKFIVYSKLFLPSKLLMTILSFLSFNPYFIAYAGVYVMYAFIVYKGSYIEDKNDSRENEVVKDIMTKTFNYFDLITVNGLPRDNVQFFPKTAECKKSTPTDFAFMLIALLCGIRAGLCDKQEGEQRLFELLKSLEKLERYKGHFYNCYDIENLKPIENRIVSTAESANLAAALFCVKGYGKTCGNTELISLCDSLNEADFSFLFDDRRGLLRICYRVDENRFDGYYDVLESEGKLAYLIAISKGVHLDAWFNILRGIIPFNNNTYLSWNGSAYEYMMSSIFIRPPRYSMLEASDRNAFLIQQNVSKNGYFGISEGCTTDFDDNMRYRYVYDGVSRLALNNNVQGRLYNPYSAFLFLPFSNGEVGQCVKNYIAKGMLSKTGLYEGIVDGVVSMQTTSHQGIIMATSVNKLYDGYLNKLFISNPELYAVRLLLAEPYVMKRGGYVSQYKREDNERIVPLVVSDNSLMQGSILSSGEYAVGCTSNGVFKRVSNGYLISPFYPYPEKCGQCKTYILRANHVSPSNLYEKATSTLSGLSVTYSNKELSCEEIIKLMPSGLGEVRRIRFYSKGVPERIKLSHYLDISLCTEDELYSHKSYFDMFIESKLFKNGASFKRINNEICPNVAIKVYGLKNTRVDTNKLNVIKRNKGFCEESCFFKEGEYVSDGRVLYPCFALCGEFLLEGDFYDVFIVLAVGNNCVERVDWDYEVLSEGFDLFERAKDYRKECIDFSEKSANIIGRVLLGFYPQNELCKKVDGKIRIGVKKENLRDDRELKNLSLSLLRLGYENDFVLLGEHKDIEYNGQQLLNEKNYAVFADFDSKTEIITSLEIVYPLKPEIKLEGINAGEGQFTECGYMVIPFCESTLKPYSNILFSREGGVITTENSQFSFADNSREYKLTNWYNDEMQDIPSEFVYIYYNGVLYDVCNYLSTVYFVENNKSTYHFSLCEIYGKIVIRVNERGNICKKLFLRSSGGDVTCKVVFAIRPCLGYKPSNCYYAQTFRAGLLKIVNKENGLSMEYSCNKGIPFIGEEMLLGLLTEKECEPKGGLYGFVEDVKVNADEVFVEALLGKKANKKSEYVKVDFGAITITTPDLRLNLLYNLCLYKQVMARLEARASFYQCVGAFRFREQLQDCLTILYTDPDRVKEHILLCASRQYEEGDVMHWWHMPIRGIRTRNTDDGLFLCYVTRKYIHRTGDRSILERKLPFLHSRPLEDDEFSRYEKPTIKRESSELREHLFLAINKVLDFGTHDLLLVKGGDLLDGLDRIGKSEKAESVWLSQFAYMVITDCISLFEGNRRIELIRSLDRLKDGINKSFKGDCFIAYYNDDVKIIGKNGDKECALYLLTQSFSCLCGAVDEEVYKIALKTALKLVDEDSEIIKLFSPPFKDLNKYGCVASYPEGVRENGGQNTHAAVWFVCALFKAGFYDKAYELMNMLNPIVKSQGNDVTVYQGEPYVFSADINDGEYKGRAGWSWYTAAASWYYVLVTEYLFGLNFVEGRVYFTPRFPSFIDSGELKLRLKGGEYTFLIKKGEEDRIIVNGRVFAEKYITPLENKGRVCVEVIYRDKGEKTID